MTTRQKVKRLRNAVYKTGANLVIPAVQKAGHQVRPVGYFACVKEWSESSDRAEGESFTEFESPSKQNREISDELMQSDLASEFARVKPGFTTRQFRLILKNARVYDMRAVVVHQSNQIFSELTYEYATDPKHFYFWNDVTIPKVSRREKCLGVAHSVSADNYAHWVMEVVPQLIRLKDDLDAGEIDNIYVRCDKPYQKEWLAIIGIDLANVIPAENGQHLLVEHMIVYAMPMRNCEFSKSQLALFRSLVESKWKQIPGRKIFIGREGGTRSFSLSDADLRQVVADCGYEYVLMEEHSVSKKNQYFAEASIIAGLHGGGFGGIVFSDSSTELREIHSPLIPNLCYWRIANSHGMPYKAVYADIQSDSKNAGIQKGLQLTEQALREFLMTPCGISLS